MISKNKNVLLRQLLFLLMGFIAFGVCVLPNMPLLVESAFKYLIPEN